MGIDCLVLENSYEDLKKEGKMIRVQEWRHCLRPS